jgi:hypothetical protein
MKTGTLFKELSVKWMLDFTLNFNRDGLIHFVAGYYPNPDFP